MTSQALWRLINDLRQEAGNYLTAAGNLNIDQQGEQAANLIERGENISLAADVIGDILAGIPIYKAGRRNGRETTDISKRK